MLVLIAGLASAFDTGLPNLQPLATDLQIDTIAIPFSSYSVAKIATASRTFTMNFLAAPAISLCHSSINLLYNFANHDIIILLELTASTVGGFTVRSTLGGSSEGDSSITLSYLATGATNFKIKNDYAVTLPASATRSTVTQVYTYPKATPEHTEAAVYLLGYNTAGVSSSSISVLPYVAKVSSDVSNTNVNVTIYLNTPSQNSQLTLGFIVWNYLTA
jgi:hypothetical protein